MRLSPSPKTVSDSTARPAANTWTWTFRGAPISIDVPFRLISRLQAEVDGHGEVGGILLGHAGKTSATVRIHDYVSIPSDTPSDGPYSLNISQLERLRRATADLDEKAVHPMSVVGYFRTQSRGTLELREAEIDLVRDHFADPTNVVLLIRTSPQQDSAGFFFWYGDVFTPFSFMEFPFDAEALRRKEIEHPAEPSPIEPIEDFGKPASEPEPSSEPPVIEPVQEIPKTASIGKKPSHRPGKLLTVSAVVLALLGVSGFLLRDRWLPARKRSIPVQVASFPLQLEVEAQGSGLNIRWNPQSTPVTLAREGNLAILERDQPPQMIPLSPQQLMMGHVFYQSSAERIEFQLQIVDNLGRTAQESVLALSSRPVAVPQNPAQGHEPGPARKVQTVPLPGASANSARLAKLIEARRQSQSAIRPYTPPPTGQGPAEPERAILLDPPAAVPNAPAITPGERMSESQNRLPAQVVPPPAERLTPPAEPASSLPRPAAPSPILLPPVPVKKVRPDLEPSTAAWIPANREIQVAIRLNIDQTGRVVRAQPVQHDPGFPSRLEKVAMGAAMQWQFKPARLGDNTVPSEFIVTFVFQNKNTK